MIRDHRKPRSSRGAIVLVWGAMVAVLLVVVAFVAYVNQRVAPKAMAPRQVQAAPVLEPELAMPDALFDAERMERLLPILKGETR